MKAEIKGFDFNLVKELEKEFKGLLGNISNLEVGFFETAKYTNGDYVASIASMQEYGSINIPPRPFFRNAINKNKVKWIDLLKQQLVSNQNLELSLNQVGEIARGDIITSINQTNTPPNALSTIKQKGSSKPLVDTGFMRSSVNYKVVK
ncbi:hypothetical protein [uncultured Helicobacter sp.]|uniref:hypothetical protein n=1 Tax=uncultured Helicobacter sp. TaxID=175537 RepID=UPI002609CCA0|nr:hypothetical protein [uncultured Helicobacter sp.]